ncbi:DUF87 domain-containing protein [Candidatus Woesearchaeota archaeon]|nr:DUF87 domain-containing protein [Candidatus Woesearchaeota archaeon]
MYNILIGRNQEDQKKYGTEGTIFIGKHYVKMGQTTSLSNNIYMDVAKSHVVFVVGKRGSGKSYSMGVIAESMMDLPSEIRKNLAVIMLDTMGIYWTMKYFNKQDKELLKEWDLEAKPMNVNIFTPVGYYKKYKEEDIPTDFPFAIKTSELSIFEWSEVFDIDLNTPMGSLIERVIEQLKESKENYDMDDIIEAIQKDDRAAKDVKDAAENRFMAAKHWGLFSKHGTLMEDLIIPGQITVLDVSCYTHIPGAQGLRALVIGLVAQKMFTQRMIVRKAEEYESIYSETHLIKKYEDEQEEKEPLIWLFIDECLPYSSKVYTENGLREIGKIVDDFWKGKKIKVIGYNQRTKKYGHFPVSKCYKRPKRILMAFITETGQSISCTPDHKIYSSKSFLEAQKSQDIAIPLLKPYNLNKKLVEARLLGAIFGDGWLSTNGTLVGFSGKGDNTDLEKIKHDLSHLGFKSSLIHSKKTKSQIQSSKGNIAYVKGTSYSITSATKAFRYFRKLGAPVGTKVLIPSKIPSWILKGPKEVKCEFLAGLMGADGSTPKRNIVVPSDFNPIRLSFNKIKGLEKNALSFSKQLKKLFADVGVKISNIRKRPGNIRKDGHETIKIQITIAKSIDNTINYFKNIGYRYCEQKEIEGEKWLAYLRYRKHIIKERNSLRIKAIKLYKEKGLGKTRIGRILGVPDYIVRYWIYSKGKAGVPKNFPSFEEWTKKRVKGNNLFLKIVKKAKLKEEVVYDLSVDKAHNFIADGFLVHNCHEFIPNEGKTVATQPLITLLREGRQPGISLVLASQQPGKINNDVITQSDIVIAHRLTAKIDTQALGSLMQSYMRESLDAQLNYLPADKGAALIFDDINEKIYPMRIRPRYSWHGGETPSIVIKKNKIFEF